MWIWGGYKNSFNPQHLPEWFWWWEKGNGSLFHWWFPNYVDLPGALISWTPPVLDLIFSSRSIQLRVDMELSFITELSPTSLNFFRALKMPNTFCCSNMIFNTIPNWWCLSTPIHGTCIVFQKYYIMLSNICSFPKPTALSYCFLFLYS